jgi:CubicO group peptidase (beta-lactamase class C family)
MRSSSQLILLAVCLSLTGRVFAQQPAADQNVNDLLEQIRQKLKLPALAGAIVTSQGLDAVGAVGVRKAGTDVHVTVDDQWHLGSDTKAMTATLLGVLVEQGKIRWDSTIGEVFPDIAPKLPPKIRAINLVQLLSHRAGLPHDFQWLLYVVYGNLRAQRLAVVKDLASVDLVADPGTKFGYSNAGYVVAAAMAEKVGDDSWENLITRFVFQPLGMTSVGFGGAGTAGKIDQPWGHTAGGVPFPFHGEMVDNLPVMAPAGCVHCSLSDWAKFVADQLRGARGEKSLLKPDTYKKLQTPAFDDDYALGWMLLKRSWAGGKTLYHAGTNTMNIAVVWLAPAKDVAFLACTNEGSDDAGLACDEAVTKLIQLHEERSK